MRGREREREKAQCDSYVVDIPLHLYAALHIVGKRCREAQCAYTRESQRGSVSQLQGDKDLQGLFSPLSLSLCRTFRSSSLLHSRYRLQRAAMLL